jgi:hypothetical protein
MNSKTANLSVALIAMIGSGCSAGTSLGGCAVTGFN